MDSFELEILAVENGFVVFEGSVHTKDHGLFRKKWVFNKAIDLADFIREKGMVYESKRKECCHETKAD